MMIFIADSMNLQENISRIKQVMGINESYTNRLRRLLHRVDFLVDHVIQYPDYDDDEFCSVFKSARSFFNYVISETIESMYYSHFEDVDDLSDEWTAVYNMMWEYVDKTHGDKIREYWLSKCGD